MSNNTLNFLVAFWLVSFVVVVYAFNHPTYTWTEAEVARDRVITKD